MVGLFSRAHVLSHALVFIVLGVALAGCGTRPRQVPPIQQVYEIRGAVVTANAGISRAILRGVKQRLDQSITDTTHAEPMPRAVMNIHVVSVGRTAALDGVRTQTEVSVTLTDVPSGLPVLVKAFMVYSFTLDEQSADDGAAEAIAARLRVEYALAQPTIRVHAPPQKRLSTRMTDDQPALAAHETVPIVVPLKTAKAVGADQDPLLNSKTLVEPAAEKASVPASSLKAAEPASVENALEAGAKVKVVIKPKAVAPADAEPCVETIDTKC
jgi:hypothetical protein